MKVPYIYLFFLDYSSRLSDLIISLPIPCKAPLFFFFFFFFLLSMCKPEVQSFVPFDLRVRQVLHLLLIRKCMPPSITASVAPQIVDLSANIHEYIRRHQDQESAVPPLVLRSII